MKFCYLFLLLFTVFRPDYTRPDLNELGTMNKSEVLFLQTWLISDNNDIDRRAPLNWRDWAKIQQCKEAYYTWDKYQHYTVLLPNLSVTEDANVLYITADYDDQNRQKAWEHYMCGCVEASIWCRENQEEQK